MSSSIGGIPKPEALNMTINTLQNEHLEVKLSGQNGILNDTQ